MQSPTHTNRLKLMIPALSTQVDFFLQDLRANKIQVDRSTVYAFWIGGNNMINSYNHLLKWHPADMMRFLFASPTAGVLKAIDHMRKSMGQDNLPKTVYVFNLMDPGLTHSYYKTDIAPLATALSAIYNFWTYLRVDYYNLLHTTKVRVIPIDDWYTEASQHHYFKAHLGQNCQVKGGNFTKADSIPNNCQGFMYWNDIHPAVDMQKITAYRFLSVISR